MLNGFGRKTMGASAKEGFGFGQFRNQKFKGKQETEEASELEDDPFVPPEMEQMPNRATHLGPRKNPLDDLRKSFNARNKRELVQSVRRPLDNDGNNLRQNIMSRSSNNFSDLKLTSLKERRSQTRGLKMQGLQKPVQSNALSKYVADQDEIVIEKPEESIPTVLNGKFTP